MTRPLILLSNASVTRSNRKLLRGLDWELERGEHWAVCGVNGAGKTTLLRLMRGEIAPDQDGERRYDFGEGAQETVLGLRHRIGIVSSDLQDFYVLHGGRATGREIVLAGFFDSTQLHEQPTVAQEVTADEVFKSLGIRGLAAMSAESMSTGQLRQVLIARALAWKPDVLLLDECLDGLDAAAREKMAALIDKAAEMTTLVVAAHHAEDLPACIGRALVLEDGAIVAQGGRGRALAHLTPEAEPAECPLPPSGHGEDVPFIFRISNADVVMDGTHVLYRISWEMLPGQNWAVLGENGAGKTTLLRMLLSEVAPYAEQGGIQWFGGVPFDTVRPTLGLVSQQLQASYGRELGWEVTVLETVLSGFRCTVGLLEEPEEQEVERARQVMAFMGVADLADESLRNLSYGQQRRVFLARAVAFGPRLLLLDEPLSGLDPRTREEVLPLLNRLAGRGTPTVIVTHHREQVFEAITHVLEMSRGRIIFQGTREQWRTRR
ncbi:ABC transporter ATP-binding protein [Salidesulfovibrio onnuriiensis]|uniref:ABC transporter ATP-binding protein n=1 Tax=Salidesulfovibrio onnuriiensis TaxID=2583823 RepID=UPI0011C7DBCA|nr:ATP-binding cassette domain-containing protein [Salidesulfovibrio onnuriiensis]